MKPSELSLPRRDLTSADAVTLERQRILQRAVDETYFTALIAPGVSSYQAGIAEVMNGNSWVIRIPVGGGSASTTTAFRALWPGTRPRFYVTYTSPVGNVALFNFRGFFRVFGGGTTATTAVTVDWTAPGPAVANTVLTTSAAITSSKFPSSPSASVRFAFQRFPVPDANPNDLDVLSALVVLEETA